MPRRSIEDLPKPPKDDRPSRVFPRRETKDEAIEGGQLRRRRIHALRSQPERLQEPLPIGALERFKFFTAGVVGEAN